jgi:hypothetical protein
MKHRELEHALMASARDLRNSVRATPDRVARVEAALNALLESQRVGSGDIGYRIAALRGGLAPMCGAGTAERVMCLAAQRCSGAGLDKLTRAQWPAFLCQLVPLVAGICGVSPVRTLLGVQP